ncbi:hypothetical protein [Acuticoccus mangrovi]|uniref:Uncharacterized protein n=1 Tax=Acuticoccus mangrovi TaxID=2796142 RepID=A0A934IJ93_9HYPH|nr:hypothetical protein [Acuticoccus mangrovi]MBJ3777498.1 hypothetical protein [Acuticoccus mangrovi]
MDSGAAATVVFPPDGPFNSVASPPWTDDDDTRIGNLIGIVADGMRDAAPKRVYSLSASCVTNVRMSGHNDEMIADD